MDLVLLDAGHHLPQHDTDDTLTRDGVRRWVMPGCLQVSPHLQQTLALLGAQGRRPLSEQRLQLLLERAYGRGGGIPSPLELASDKTIVRIDRVILSSRPGCLVPRLLERQLELALFLARLVLAFRDRVDRRFNTERLQQPHDLGTHRLVDPQSAERDTALSAGGAPGRVAIIAADVALRAVVADEQPASAMAATQEAGEQSFPPCAPRR